MNRCAVYQAEIFQAEIFLAELLRGMRFTVFPLPAAAIKKACVDMKSVEQQFPANQN